MIYDPCQLAGVVTGAANSQYQLLDSLGIGVAITIVRDNLPRVVETVIAFYLYVLNRQYV